jgi:hypothetical protein
MLAPIALYPDPVLGQILMAATYPLEVVEADRWVRASTNAPLRGAQLVAALDPLPWDPSVKSLVPFPQILHMMNTNLDWMERLGDAFLADQAAVMDAVQRLRQRAAAAGKLGSTPQQTVASEGPLITIEPPSPDEVYIPVYNPTIVYGTWPYEFPPYYFPGYFGAVVIGGFGYGWFGVPIIAPLWGWYGWDWGGHRFNIDRDRFADLNRHRPPTGGGAWQHDPAHRGGVPYRDPATRSRFSGAVSPDSGRAVRGYPTGPAASAARPLAIRPQVTAPTIESYGRGADVRGQAQRGQESRTQMRAAPSSRGGGARIAPSGGGMRR